MHGKRPVRMAGREKENLLFFLKICGRGAKETERLLSKKKRRPPKWPALLILIKIRQTLSGGAKKKVGGTPSLLQKKRQDRHGCRTARKKSSSLPEGRKKESRTALSSCAREKRVSCAGSSLRGWGGGGFVCGRGCGPRSARDFCFDLAPSGRIQKTPPHGSQKRLGPEPAKKKKGNKFVPIKKKSPL